MVIPLNPELNQFPVPADILVKWQRRVNLLAEIIAVPVAMITRCFPSYTEVLISSETPNNPYQIGAIYHSGSGRYCETVVRAHKPLLVINALTDSAWDHNPDIQLNMISYLGLPLRWPNGEMFGTFCVLDNKENHFNDITQQLMEEFAASIEQELRQFVCAQDADTTAQEPIAPGIDDSTQKEKVLRESEATARALLDTPSILTFLLDRDGIILDANKTMATRFGRSREALVGLCLWDLLPPELLETRKARILATLLTGTIQHWEDHRAGGWFANIAEPIIDEHGTTSKVAIVAYDITELKLAQESLQKSEQKYRQLVDEAATIILRCDTHGNVTFFNEFAQSFFGYSEEEIIGKNVFSTIVPDIESTGRDLHSLIAEVLHDPNRYEHNENENIKRNGERVWIAWKNRPIFNKAGELVELHSIGMDITARKQAEDALRESEALWRSLTESSPDRIITLDENLKIRFINLVSPGVCRQDLTGKPLYEFVEPPYREEVKTILENALKTGKPRRYETQYRPPDGDTIYYESIVAPQILSDRVIGLTVNARNITERKQSEQALRKAHDELEIRVRERTAELEKINARLTSEIAERQLAEQALEEERRLFVSGPTVVFKWRAAPSLPVEYVSPNVASQFGYTPEDFTSGKILFAEIIHPDDLPRFRNAIQSHAESGVHHFEQEYRLAHRDGEYLWLYDLTIIVRNKAGKITHYHGYVVNITERKLAQEQILASESELRGIMESLQDVYYRTNIQGDIVRISPSSLQVFGYEPHEMVGKPVAAFWRNPQQREILLQAMQSGGAVQNYEIEAIHKTGIDLWVSANSHFYYDTQGNILGVEGTIRNITQLKQAEEESKRQKALFEAVFRDVPDAMLITNTDRQIIMRNPAMTRIFGYEPQEVIGRKSAYLYENQDEFERQGQERFNLAAQDNLNPFIINYRRKNGEVFPGETVGSVIRDERGNAIGFIGVIRDITDRKRAEEELRRSRRHFQFLDRVSRVLTAAPDLSAMLRDTLAEILEIFSADRAWLLYPCDPQAPFWSVPFEVTRPGYRETAASGREIPSNPEAAAVFQEALQSANVLTHDFYRLSPEPEITRLFNVRTQMIIALHPKIDQAWLLGLHQCSYDREWSDDDKRLFRDIAERVTQALTNRLLQQQLELDIAERKRIEGIEKGRSKVLELLAMGATIEEVLHKLVVNAEETNPRMLCSILLTDPDRQHLHLGAAPSLPAFYNQAIDGIEIGPESGSCGTAAFTGKSVVVEDVTIHPLWRRYRDLAIQAGLRACWSEPILSSNGQVLGTFAIYYREARIPDANDIEFIKNSARLAGIAIERRHSEEQAVLHQTELAHMARLNVMGELATGIAHELNQPLTAIANFASAARKMLGGENTQAEKIVQVLDSVQTQAQRASDIIHHLRKFVKKQSMQKSTVDLNMLVNDVVGFMETETKSNNIQIKLQLQPELPLVFVDAIHIEQVLVNLIRNSLEAMTHTDLKTRRISIHTRLDEAGIPLVEVADTGPGIDKKTLKHIFEPFVTTKGSKGMGMGLSISRSIVEAHGGRLWAESEPGKGARFFLTIPIEAD